MKLGLLPVPALFVTETAPVVAPTGTVASIWVSETSVKLAPGALAKSTAVMPTKSVPVSVTLWPATPLPGATPVTVGVVSMVKVGLLPVPALLVTAIAPVAAPTGIVASIWVSETRVKLAPGALGKSTAVMPTKSVPVSVTLCPAIPLVGAAPVTVGVTSMVKVGLLPVPALLVTAMAPVAAPTGTVASIWVSETRVKLAPGALGKSTAVMPTKSVPVSVTLWPATPAGGCDAGYGRSGLDGGWSGCCRCRHCW